MTPIYFPLSRTRAFWLLFAVCALTLLPFLGLTDFNTKGEPREAVVAFSILEQNNWILPSNNGGEIPYKPPFFHWLIALAGLLNGGVVNEYVSRLPSAMALIAMTSGVFAFYSRRRDAGFALIVSLVTFTAFEIYRAGMNCRVDMVLTALTVGAMLLLYNWWERGTKGLPWLAILLMSAATLTKGPVGIIIPCLASGIFFLIRGMKFWTILWKLGISALLALVLPLGWYVAAYHQGGRAFLELVLEENFGRMTGTMTYESHLNPWYYNLITLAAGFLPWTIAAVTALFLIRWHMPDFVRHFSLTATWQRLKRQTAQADSVSLFSLVCALTVFIFYCIPASKRSVYLMPMYPFTAYFLSMLILWMVRRRRGSIAGLGDGLAAVGCLLFLIFCLVRTGVITGAIFGHGKHAASNAAMVDSLASSPAWSSWLFALVPVVCAAIWWGRIRRRAHQTALPLSVAGLVIGLYIAYGGAYQPAILNAKSMKPMAAEILAAYPNAPKDIYEFISIAEAATGNPIHYFELDFYMGDPVRNFRRERPDSGFLLIGAEDAAEWFPKFNEEGYRFKLLRDRKSSQPRHTPQLYSFTRSCSADE